MSDFQRHPNDQQSVLAWIQEWEEKCEDNPILYNKLQGEDTKDDYPLLKEDFIIILQTPIQRMTMAQFGSKGVCIDGTHGTTAYDFTLNTLMVVDEFGSGFPVAWCLSNHEDTTFIRIFFDVLKKKCGTLSPRWFMSDTANQYFNAWVGTMDTRPTKLIYLWHVDKAWRENLRQTIGDLHVEEEVYKMMRTLLEHTEVRNFEEDLIRMMDILRQSEKRRPLRSPIISPTNGSPERESGPIVTGQDSASIRTCSWRHFIGFSSMNT